MWPFAYPYKWSNYKGIRRDDKQLLSLSFCLFVFPGLSFLVFFFSFFFFHPPKCRSLWECLPGRLHPSAPRRYATVKLLNEMWNCFSKFLNYPPMKFKELVNCSSFSTSRNLSELLKASAPSGHDFNGIESLKAKLQYVSFEPFTKEQHLLRWNSGTRAYANNKALFKTS